MRKSFLERRKTHRPDNPTATKGRVELIGKCVAIVGILSAMINVIVIVYDRTSSKEARDTTEVDAITQRLRSDFSSALYSGEVIREPDKLVTLKRAQEDLLRVKQTPDVLAIQADLAGKVGDQPLSEKFYTSALRLDPTNVRALQIKGTDLARKGKHSEAASTLIEAKSQAFDQNRSLDRFTTALDLGLVEHLIGNKPAAEDLLNEAAGSPITKPLALVAKGRIAFSEGDLNKALEDFGAAARADPKLKDQAPAECQEIFADNSLGHTASAVAQMKKLLPPCVKAINSSPIGAPTVMPMFPKPDATLWAIDDGI